MNKKPTTKNVANKSTKKAPRRSTSIRVPPTLLRQIETAVASKKWLVVVCRTQDGKVFLDRTATDFPKEEIDLATRLCVEDLQLLKSK